MEQLSPQPTSVFDFSSLFILFVTIIGFLVPMMLVYPPVPPRESDLLFETHSKLGPEPPRSKEKSKTSTDDISSGRRGGLRSHKGSGGRTKAQLYEEAMKKNIEGRSSMTKAELEKAVGR